MCVHYFCTSGEQVAICAKEGFDIVSVRTPWIVAIAYQFNYCQINVAIDTGAVTEAIYL